MPDPRTGSIVVELKTTNALPLLRQNCSKRIVPVPTNQLNARRHAPSPAFLPLLIHSVYRGGCLLWRRNAGQVSACCIGCCVIAGRVLR